MDQELIRPETRIDAKTAEQALMLAIRLQEERGASFTLEQLHQTAAEAGIDQECLNEALKQVMQPVATVSPVTSATHARFAVPLPLRLVLRLSMLAVLFYAYGLCQRGEWTEAGLSVFVAIVVVNMFIHRRDRGRFHKSIA